MGRPCGSQYNYGFILQGHLCGTQAALGGIQVSLHPEWRPLVMEEEKLRSPPNEVAICSVKPQQCSSQIMTYKVFCEIQCIELQFKTDTLSFLPALFSSDVVGITSQITVLCFCYGWMTSDWRTKENNAVSKQFRYGWLLDLVIGSCCHTTWIHSFLQYSIGLQLRILGSADLQLSFA